MTMTIITNIEQNTPKADENLKADNSLAHDKGNKIKNYKN
mgnify:FL=1